MRRRTILVVLATLALLASLTLGIAIPTTGAAGAEPCSNEAIRTEQHSTYLDDCRAYELVTPAQKNAADVLPQPERTRTSADGNAVQFASLTGFGDTQGTGSAAEYIATRRADGVWHTHGITPVQQPTAFIPDVGAGLEPRYVSELSSDLSHGVFIAKSPLTNAPNVAHTVNLYLRDDLLTPGAGNYQLLSDAVSDQGEVYDPAIAPFVAGSSTDFSHVLFESVRSLLPETAGLNPEAPKLYEWVNGTLRFVGMVPRAPDVECGGGGPACVSAPSQAGQGARTFFYTIGTISRDGRRVIFTVPNPNEIASEIHNGQLYLRDDQDTLSLLDDVTVQVNASERTEPETQQSALYWAASGDGSKVFFTSHEKLTDDDPNSSSDLYRYDHNAPAGNRLTRISLDSEPADNQNGVVANGHEVRGAIGASTDGETVYFIAGDSTGSQLIGGGSTTQPVGNAGAPGNARIYRWHAGILHEVGGVNDSAELDGLLAAQPWGKAYTRQFSRVSPDGRHLAFITQGTDQLLSLYGKPEYDHGDTCSTGLSSTPACLEVYAYDADANGGNGDLRCASCRPSGSPGKGGAYFFTHFATGATKDSSHLGHQLSDDGHYVFFNSDDDLLEEDTNSTADAYSYNTQTEELSLLSSGTSNTKSIFLDASADGKDAFILTRSQLVGADHDQAADLYDVRLDGGHPEPLAVAPCHPLAPDSCPARAASQPTLATTPPTGAAGPGNPARHRRHKRHRKHKRQTKRERAAPRNRGGS